MLNHKKILACLISLALNLQACAPSLPEYKNLPKEKIETPEKFPHQDDSSKKDDLVRKNWKLLFNDQQLIDLIDTALRDNQELNIIKQDINIANNEVMARRMICKICRINYITVSYHLTLHGK